MVNPIFIIALLLGVGFLLPITEKLGKKFSGLIFFLTLGAISFISIEWLYAFIMDGQTAIQIFTAGVKPPLSINLQLGLQEAVFISSINILSLIGAVYLIRHLNEVGIKAQVLYLLMVLGLNGLVLTRDLFNLFVFVEITGISTYALIGADLRLKSLLASFKYMLAGGIASVFLLLGIIYLYSSTGTLNIDGMISASPLHSGLKIAGIAIFFLFFSLLIEMKQFPANGWALDVYEASHPGIAGLISAAGTAAVFFALYKVMPLGNELWYNLIAAIGIITFVASNIMGLRQKNTNRLLGYSSIAQMGLLLGAMGLGFLFGGIGKDFQFIIFALFINHFIAKAGLFWIAGIIKKSDYKEWGVLRKKPCLLFIFGLFVLGLIGFPPFPGFWGKWSLIMELASNQKFVYIWLILIGSLLETVYMLRWFGHAVKGESEETSEASEKKFSILEKLIPVALLATVYVVLGYFTGIKTNSSVMMTFIPIAAASGFLLLDWLPAKIKGVLAIAAVSAYAVYLFPQLNGYPLFFNLLFLSGSVILLIATLNRKKLSAGFYPLIILMIGSLSSLTESSNLLQFFVAWEIMTVSSYLLILQGKNAKDSALKYVLFSLGGAFLILAGIGYAFAVTPETINYVILGMAGKYSVAVFALISIGFLIKSAAVGLHVWVPGAYSHSDDDVTPFISGLLSKAGIFGFTILMIVAGVQRIGFIELPTLIGWIGALTAVLGTLIAVFQEDAKKLLAYSSMGQVGYIVLSMAVMSHLGWASAFWHSVNHFLFKALLFLAIAGVIYRTGTDKMYKMGGLIKKMPLSFISVMIGIIAASGVPPLTGFGSKWLLYEALIEKGWYLQTGFAFFASTVAFLYLYRIVHTIFLGQPKEQFKNVKEAPLWFIIPQYILIIGIMVLSFKPELLLQPISQIINPFFGSSLTWEGTTVYSSLGYWNAAITMVIVGAIFVFLLIYLLIISPKVQKVKQFNIVFAAERPETPELTHYAYNFFLPYKRAIGFLVKPVVKKFWNGVSEWSHSISETLRQVYTGNAQTYILHILMSGIILYLISLGVN